MSNSDSFIEEVTDEVRREKLFGYLRRYGWIGIACVLLLVGGAAWREYSNAQDRAAAEATGDALLAAVTQSDETARLDALGQLDTSGPSTAVTMLLQAAAQQEAGELDAAVTTLEALASNGDVAQKYRDLAAFKAAVIPTGDRDARRAALEILSQPGAPYRLLALEQMVYLSLDAGETEAALAIMREIEEDAAVSQGLRDRVQTLMVALGEPMPDQVTE